MVVFIVHNFVLKRVEIFKQIYINMCTNESQPNFFNFDLKVTIIFNWPSSISMEVNDAFLQE